RPGEDALHLKSVAHAFGQLRFQSVVVRMSFIKQSANRPIIRIDGGGSFPRIGPRSQVAVDIYLRPQISEWGPGRDDQVSFIHLERLMNTTRSYIGNHSSQRRR